MSIPVTERQDFVIRPAQPDDLGSIAALLFKNGMLHRERDSALLTADDSTRIIAALGRQVIGHVYVGDRDGIPIISGVTVDESCREQGVGTALVEKTIRHLNSQQRGWAEVQVDDDRPELLEWWQKRGFHVMYRCIGLSRELNTQELTPYTAFERIHRASRPYYMHVYTPDSVQELHQALTTARRPDIRAAAAKLSMGDGSGLPLMSTPWFITPHGSQPGTNSLQAIRWGSVPMDHADYQLLREFREPIATHAPSNPRGQRVPAYGTYLLARESTQTVVPLRVDPGKPAVRVMGYANWPVLQALHDAARVQ